MVRRIVPLIASSGLLLSLGLVQIHSASAQDAKKDAPKAEAPKPAAPAPAPAKVEEKKPAEPAKEKADDKAKKEEAPKATEAPLPPIPKEVQDKIDAARRAVAEAIVAAQDAGLVETTIDPPPILDILVTGRATDARTIKNPASKKPFAVSPEVFAAWFTGYGSQAFESVDFVKEIRIMQPSAGLKSYFDQRAMILRHEIEEVRKAKGQPAAKPAEKKEEPKPAEKKEEPKPAETKKPDEAKKK